MKWNNDRSLLLSRVCVWGFTVALAALFLTAPWFWNWVLWRANVRIVYIAVTYASGIPAAVVLWCLHQLLRNISEEEVFIQENVRSLRIMSWCLIAAALVYLVGSAFDWYLIVFAVAAAFVGLILRVVKNVFAQAVELKNENDFTI
ncbi:DUF2975 domain-containing protein [uncultured Ruthenibacterium sp.]|uniref:DUF2975 domain-containing protein n=1 Tax=uncultured Ruthenibacterium sp. TaxID=1905347 RepID=UPI00349E4CDF